VLTCYDAGPTSWENISRHIMTLPSRYMGNFMLDIFFHFSTLRIITTLHLKTPWIKFMRISIRQAHMPQSFTYAPKISDKIFVRFITRVGTALHEEPELFIFSELNKKVCQIEIIIDKIKNLLLHGSCFLNATCTPLRTGKGGGHL